MSNKLEELSGADWTLQEIFEHARTKTKEFCIGEYKLSVDDSGSLIVTTPDGSIVPLVVKT